MRKLRHYPVFCLRSNVGESIRDSPFGWLRLFVGRRIPRHSRLNIIRSLNHRHVAHCPTKIPNISAHPSAPTPANKKKQGLKQANTSMSVPPLASYEWAIKYKRNRKTAETQARSNPFCPILGPCPTLRTIASGNFL